MFAVVIAFIINASINQLLVYFKSVDIHGFVYHLLNSGKETLCFVLALVPVYRWPYMLRDIEQRLLHRYVYCAK